MTTINGVDVSHYDISVDFAELKTNNYLFAFMKCTEGLNFKDPMFPIYWAQAKAAGVIRGAYHFFLPDIDPIQQAEAFAVTMGPLTAEDMPPVLDLEVTNGMSSANVVSRSIAFLEAIAGEVKKTPIIYSDPSFIETLGSPTQFTNYPLWIAEYGVMSPNIPKVWARWTFWQNSQSGNVSGIGSRCDTNYFNGDLEDLQLFCKS